MNMPTNNSKLLEKVLSKWAFDELPDNKYNKNQIAIRISEIKEMLLDMEAEAREDQKAWDTAQEEEYTEIAKRKARADTAKQIFKELDKILAEDKCECEHSKCDHDDELDEDNKPDTSCIECACMKYEPYNFNGQLPALKKKYNIEE